MKKSFVLKYLAVLLVFGIAGCVTNDSPTGAQSGDVSIGRGLYVEASSLIESDVAVFPQLGYGRFVTNVALSPDNLHVISADDVNGIIKLWDIQNGRLLRTFWGHDARIGALAYCIKGKTFVSGDFNGNIKIWDTESGMELHNLTGHSGRIHSLDYSPDGKHIVSASDDRTITIWDAEKGMELYTFGDNNGVTSASYSPDGRYIVSSSRNSLVIWESASGIKLKTLVEGELVWSASWSPDGQRIVSVNEQGIITIWNIGTNRVIRSINSGDNERRKAVYVSRNSIASWSYNKGVIFWSTDTGQKTKEIPPTETFFTIGGNAVKDGRHSVYISIDRSLLVEGSNQGSINIIEFNSGTILHNIKGTTTDLDIIQVAQFDHNTQQIILGVVSSDYIFNFNDCRLQKNKEFEQFRKNWVYNHDRTKGVYISLFNYKQIGIFDVQNGNELKSLLVREDTNFQAAAFSPDDKYVVIGGNGNKDGNIQIWEWGAGRDGRIVRSFSPEETKAVNYSPDGKYIVSGHSRTIKVWNAETYREIYTLRGHTNGVRSVVFSPDGKYLASGSQDTTIRIWDTGSRRELICINDSIGPVSFVEFSPDGKCLLAASSDGSVYLYDVSDIGSGIDKRNRRIAQIALFIEYNDQTNSYAYEWIVITPDGYYNASPAGDRYLNVRVNNTVSGIDAYRSVLYNPDVVQARLQGRPDPASKANVTIQQAASFIPPTVTIQSPANFTTTNTATTNLSVSITSTNQPIRNVKILVNGRLIGRDELVAVRSSGLQAERASLTVTGNQTTVNFSLPLELEPGSNRIEVVAFNGYSENRRYVDVTRNAPAGERPPLPNLWIVAVGVNGYDNAGQRLGGLTSLNFAVADAKGLIDSLKAQEGRRYAKVNSMLIADGERLAPTTENIRQGFKFLEGADPRRDVVIIFLAGHGVSAQGGRFFFLPKDAAMGAGRAVDASRAISGDEIMEVLDAPGNRLVFIDACQSGGVDSDRMVRSLMDTNAFVFAASRGNELSYEDPQLGHGYFTYSIMSALGGAPAALAQGNVSVLSMSGFVKDDVPRRTGGRQNPSAYSLGFYDFPMALINAPR